VTDRLYYTDPYLTEFDAQLLQLVELPDQRRAAVLDRTAFYPTSGGQPFDTGLLGTARVVDVIDDAGTVLHVVDGEVEISAGLGTERIGVVHGRIDWDRRFNHMQQHTGQHVLSAAFDRLADVRTVSFHLGTSTSTIDLHREVTPLEIERAEQEANRIIWEDRAVTVRFADTAEAAALPLRKEPAREGMLRLIDIEHFDLSACGGTHVSRTGAIGIVAISGWERFRGGTRIEFVCGGRALLAYRSLRDLVAAGTRLVSTVPGDLPVGIERLQNESKDLKRQIKELQSRLVTYEAGALAGAAEQAGATRVVAAALDAWDAPGLKSIATAIAGRAGHVAILIGTIPPAPIVVARSADESLDCAVMLKQIVSRFGGKGGGRPELAQGGGLSAASDEVLAFARSLIKTDA
jgi:alanyl-tRNA synthetase